jgi:hypothetical protein
VLYGKVSDKLLSDIGYESELFQVKSDRSTQRRDTIDNLSIGYARRRRSGNGAIHRSVGKSYAHPNLDFQRFSFDQHSVLKFHI